MLRHPVGMYLMLWLFLTTTGGATSGSAEFPTKEACEAGRKQFAEMLVAFSEESGPEPHPHFRAPLQVRCVKKETGKP